MIKKAANHFKLIVNGKWLIVIFILLLFTIHYSLFTKEVHAATCQIPANATSQETINAFNKCAIEKNIFDDKIFNFNQIAGTIDSLNTHLLGESWLHPETNTITQGKGALNATAGLVAGLYSTPPASGVGYFAQKIQDFNPVKPAYAQEGVGFSALSPVQPLWTIFRNASYVGFVIVFVIMGFMIMFRAHISPQAVATVQDSIPRIVVALILVTFSYALAGLMIDLMFLIINIAINLFAQSGFILADEASRVIFDKSIIGVIVDAWPDIFGMTANALKDLIDDVITFGGDIVGIIKWSISGIAALIGGIGAFGGTGAGELSKQMAGESLKFPLLSGGFDSNAIGKLIAIGFLFMAPEAANMVKKFVGGQGGGGGGFAPGAAIGAAIGAGAAPVGAFARGAGRAAWERGPIARRFEAGRMLRQEAAAESIGLPTFAAPKRVPKGGLKRLIDQQSQGTSS